MKKLTGVVLLLLVAVMASPGQEDEILKLKQRIIAMQNAGELGFRNFTFCSKILGYASYVPLPEPSVDRNGKLLVYYEPVNLFTNRKEDLYEIWFTQDMIILDEKGQLVHEWKNLLEYHNTTRLPVLDVYAQNELSLGGELPPGNYLFKAVLKDTLRGKEAVHTQEFRVK